MNQHDRPTRPRTARIGLLAVLLIPLFLVLNAPVLAAVVPTALLAAVATMEPRNEARALPAAELVDAHDAFELQRVAAAQAISAQTRRVA